MIEIVHSDEYSSLPTYNPSFSEFENENEHGCAKSLELLLEALSTPSKDINDNQISRFNDNTISYLSPATKQLHHDLAYSRKATCVHHTNDTLRDSRKTVIESLDWMIQYGMITENQHAAEIFDDFEKYIQKTKWKLQQIQLQDKNKATRQGNLEFATYNHKKKNQRNDLRE